MNVSPFFESQSSYLTINCHNGTQCFFKGLDDIQKVKSIRGRNGQPVTTTIIEEASEVKKEDALEQLDLRMRGESHFTKRFFLVFNPIYKTHWIYKRFFAGVWRDSDREYIGDDVYILKTTYRDNKFLAPDDIKKMENIQNQYYKNVYADGNWGVLGKLVFPNVKVKDLTKLKEDLKEKGYDDYRYGLDFGFNHPSAFSKSMKQGNCIYVLDEVYKREMTNKMLHDAVRPKLRLPEKDVIRCDSASPDRINELRLLGLNARGAIKGPGSIEFGIQYLNNYQIIVDEKCQNTINEFEIYQYEQDKYGEYMEIPVDENNHAMDNIRYAWEDDMRVERNKSRKKTRRRTQIVF